MPSLIENIISQQSDLTTVKENDTATYALDLMIENDYSQLPVVDSVGRLTGIVTYQSIIQAARSFEVKADELHIRDVTQTNIKSFDIEDNLFDLLDEIKKNNAVVIIEPDETPIGIVTSYDAAEFLRTRSEGLMRIEEIERSIKTMILSYYSSKDGKLNTDWLDQDIQAMVGYRLDVNSNNKKLKFSDLNMNDYINFLVRKQTWDYFEPILKIKREALITLLAKARETRNDMAHFRKEISSRSLDDLIYCARWFEGRFEKFQESRNQSEIQVIIENYEQGTDDEKVINQKSPRQARQSVYAALANWLFEQDVPEVTLTFEQVEGILKRPLPDSALELRAWWANDRVGHLHSMLWLDAGWRVDSVSLSDRWVKFSRK
jgi:CBS domain-containing protein